MGHVATYGSSITKLMRPELLWLQIERYYLSKWLHSLILTDIRDQPTCPCGMCDFFLWGHLQAKVYKEKPNTLEELKVAVQNQPALNNSNEAE